MTISSDYALVLDDLNSDLREVDLAIFRRDGDRWRVILSQDDAGFPGIGDSDPYRGQHAAGAAGYGYAVGEHYAWAWGRGRPGSVVQIQFKDETIELEANKGGGWWLFVCQTSAGDPEVPWWIV